MLKNLPNLIRGLNFHSILAFLFHEPIKCFKSGFRINGFWGNGDKMNNVIAIGNNLNVPLRTQVDLISYLFRDVDLISLVHAYNIHCKSSTKEIYHKYMVDTNS